MTMLQNRQIGQLKKDKENLTDRITYNCWDCLGREKRKKFDCENPKCPFYTIRPQSLLKIPHISDLVDDNKPVDSQL